jgi:hypothetical protein
VSELICCLQKLHQAKYLAPVRLEANMCNEKVRLVLEWNTATEHYSDAVTNLNGKTGISAHPEYEQMQRIVKDRRGVMERARFTFDKHVSDHGC